MNIKVQTAGFIPKGREFFIVHITKRKTLAIQNMDFDATVDYFHLRYQVNQQATLFPAAYLNERHKHVNKEEECRHVVESFLRYLLSP